MPSFVWRRFQVLFVLTSFIGLLCFYSGYSQARGPMTPESTVIFLTASWCGTCRELKPIVADAVEDAHGKFQQLNLDVDSPNAPEQASKFDITLNGSDLPQVYLYKGGKTTLIYDGKHYHYGHAHQVRDQIRNTLSSLGSP